MAALDLDLDFTTRVGAGQRAGFVLLAALLLSFVFARTSARLVRGNVRWFPGNVQTSGGLHIHHMVWGILALLVAGFLQFALDPGSPWIELLAALFGVGAGLTLDEFALWLRLEDVYWSQEGRQSVDAVVIALVLGGLVAFGLSPFDIEGAGSWTAVVVVAFADAALCLVTILKGKLVTGVVGVFVPPVALVGAVRLAKPRSWWARRFYGARPQRGARALARHRKREGLRTRVRDLVAGAPDSP